MLCCGYSLQNEHFSAQALSRRIRNKSYKYQESTMQHARNFKRRIGFKNRLRDVEAEPRYFNIERHSSGPPRLHVRSPQLTRTVRPLPFHEFDSAPKRNVLHINNLPQVWDYPSRRQQRAELVPVHRAPEFRVDVQRYLRMKESMNRFDDGNRMNGGI